MIIVNQTAGHLCVDMANVMIQELEESITLLCDKTDASVRNGLDKRVTVKNIIHYNNSTIIRRILTWVVALVQMCWILLRQNRKERLLIVSNPPFTTFIPLLFHNPFSLLIYDVYPDVLVSSSILKEKNILIRCWKRINHKIFAKAEKVYTITDEMADVLSQYIERTKVRVVPCWPDAENVEYVQKDNNEFIKANNLESKFVVMYSGNLGMTHRMDVLVDLAERMKGDSIEFVIIGEGGKRQMIQHKINDINPPNVRLLPYQPYEALSHSLSASDIAVVTLDPESANMSIPNKIYNLMNLGRPIMAITSTDSALSRLIEKYDIGKTFHPDDIEGMENWILEMKQNRTLYAQICKNSKIAGSNYTINNALMFCR